VCYACHTFSECSEPDFSQSGMSENFFHTWRGDNTVVHDGADGDGMALWGPISGGFMDIVNGGTVRSGKLPFYASPSDPIEARDYSPTLNSSYISCLTCHDPHGTAATWEHHENDGTDSTQGMPRIFPRTWDYSDPLCSECHDEAP